MHPLYHAWRGMIMRCYNPSAKGYATHGRVGVGVCDRWRRDFWSFVRDMGDRPPSHVLARRDDTADFTPENCYWKESDHALRG